MTLKAEQILANSQFETKKSEKVAALGLIDPMTEAKSKLKGPAHSIRKAVIPAAGLGTRFLPASKTVPKEMLPIVDKPGLLYIMEEIAGAGIEQVVLIAGRGKSAIEDFFDTSYELEDQLVRAGKEDLLQRIHGVKDMVEVISIRQKQAKGLGHAVLCAEPVVGQEPFALLLGDELMITAKNEPTAIGQLCQAHQEQGMSCVAVMEVPLEETSKYGIVAAEESPGGFLRIRSVVEKPRPQEAPSRFALPGRYVFESGIFTHLKSVGAGVNGEIQLTDGMTALAQQEGLLATTLKARRYDAGDRLGYLQANLELALEHPELGPGFRRYLKEFVANNRAMFSSFMFAVLMPLLVLLGALGIGGFSSAAWAYIPEPSMILSRTGLNNGNGFYQLEQDVILPTESEPFILRERWTVRDEHQMRLEVEGRGFLQGIVNMTLVYDSHQRHLVDAEGQVRSSRLSEDWHEPFFHFRRAATLRSLLANLNILPAEDELARDFVRLSRTGGGVTYAFGTPTPVGHFQLLPGLWIEQDQFVIRKLRLPSQVLIQADDYQRFERSLWMPRLRTISWAAGSREAKIQLTAVRALPQNAQNQQLVNPAQLKTQAKEVTPLRMGDYELIRDFYSRFR